MRIKIIILTADVKYIFHVMQSQNDQMAHRKKGNGESEKEREGVEVKGRKMDRVGIRGEKQCHYLYLYLFFIYFFLHILYTMP